MQRGHLQLSIMAVSGALLAAAAWWHVHHRLNRDAGKTPTTTSQTTQTPPDLPQPVVPDRLSTFQPELQVLIKRYVAMVRRTPEQGRAHATLGLVYEANALWPEARACYETAYALEGSQPLWVNHAARAAQRSGDVEGAVRLLRRAAQKFPDFAPIHHRLGTLLLEIGALDEAATQFQKTIAIEPNRAEGYVGLGDARLQQRRYAQSIVPLEKALALEPDFKMAHHLLGTAYRALNRIEEAKPHLQRGTYTTWRYLKDSWSQYLPQYKRTVWTRVQRGEELARAGRVKEALALLEPMLQASPDDVTVLRTLASIYIQMGRLADALGLLQRANQSDKHDVEVYLNLVDCYSKMNRMDDALREGRHAVDAVPDHWIAHYALGLALARSGDYPAAYQAFKHALSFNPQDASLYAELGMVCDQLGRHEEARKHRTEARLHVQPVRVNRDKGP